MRRYVWFPIVAALAALPSACSSPSGNPSFGVGPPPPPDHDAGQVLQDAGDGHDAGDHPPAPDGGSDASSATDGAAGGDSGNSGDSGDSGNYGGPWSPVSFGVTTKDTGGGNNIVIAYGGYTATDGDSQAWVTEMTSTRLAQLGVGHMYAVRGPEDPDYAAREIGNSELATALATQAMPASYVIVIAHSSGGFVADELFTFATPGVLAKVAYFNLDGGSWALTDALVGAMRGVYFCNAHDSVAGDSENTSSDESLHAEFAASHFFTVDADGSGCDVGAGWCLHDTLITNHPHDPTTYDLALDYTDFTAGRQVVTSYIDQAVSDGVL
jgi:hypothetical protein